MSFNSEVKQRSVEDQNIYTQNKTDPPKKGPDNWAKWASNAVCLKFLQRNRIADSAQANNIQGGVDI